MSSFPAASASSIARDRLRPLRLVWADALQILSGGKWLAALVREIVDYADAYSYFRA